MSASQDKKRRQAERADGVDKRSLAEREAARKAKKERTRWGIVGAIIVVFAVVVILLNTNLFYSGTTALTINGYEYTNADFQYYYLSAYSNFVSNNQNYISMFFDTSEDLDKQAFDPALLGVTGEGLPENPTWKDYFKSVAIDNMVEITALYDSAVKSGYTLSEEEQAEIDEIMASFETAATANGLRDAGAFVSFYYGKGNTLDSVRELITRGYIASGYAQRQFDSYSYTTEELDAYYDEHKDELDAFSFNYYLVAAEQVEVTETVTDEETGEETEQTAERATEETMAEAKETAERLYDVIESGRAEQAMSFSEAVGEVMGEEAVENVIDYKNALGVNCLTFMPDSVSDWLTDASRTEGDMALLEVEDSGWCVLLFNGRSDNSDYNAVNFRHILVKAVDSDGDGEFSAEELTVAEDKINELYDEWKNGEATEDSFASLASANSEDSGSKDNGGLYEHVGVDTMVEGVNDYIFDPARQPGDTSVIFNQNSSYTGYHLVYFVGTDEMSYHDCLADYGYSSMYSSVEGLRQPDYTAWHDELVAGYSADVNSFINWFAKV